MRRSYIKLEMKIKEEADLLPLHCPEMMKSGFQDEIKAKLLY